MTIDDLGISSGVRVVVNTWLPPGALLLVPSSLTDEEERAIAKAMAAVRAAGGDPVAVHAAAYEALFATGKVRAALCGSEAAARVMESRPSRHRTDDGTACRDCRLCCANCTFACAEWNHGQQQVAQAHQEGNERDARTNEPVSDPANENGGDAEP